MNALNQHNRSDAGASESESLERDLLVTVVVAALLSLAVAAYVRFVDEAVAAYPVQVHVWPKSEAKRSAAVAIRTASPGLDRSGNH